MTLCSSLDPTNPENTFSTGWREKHRLKESLYELTEKWREGMGRGGIRLSY